MRAQRGAVAVEFALILPLLLMLVLGIIEFGFGYHSWDVTQNAAREGARLGAVSNNTFNIVADVQGALDGVDPNQTATITVRCDTGPDQTGQLPRTGFAPCLDPAAWEEGDIVQVRIEFAYDFLTPFPGLVGLGSQMDMTSTAEARYEGQ